MRDIMEPSKCVLDNQTACEGLAGGGIWMHVGHEGLLMSHNLGLSLKGSATEEACHRHVMHCILAGSHFWEHGVEVAGANRG